MRFIVTLVALLSCASPARPGAALCRVVPGSLPPAPVAPTPPAGDVYLPPDQAGGSPFCFNPDSKALRTDIKQFHRDDGALLDARALAADVDDLHAAMEKLYAGYPELVQSATFDVDRFFADWATSVRAAGSQVSFGDGVVRRVVELKHQIHDQHLIVWGAGLAKRPDLAFSEYQAPGKVEGVSACSLGSVSPVAGTPRVASQLTRQGLVELTTFSAQSTVPLVDVTCGARTVRFERRTSDAKPYDDRALAYETRTVGDATVIVVRRLQGSPETKQVLAKIPAQYDVHRKKPVIVFDFRGNGGGDDTYVHAWIDKAKRGGWAESYVAVRSAGAARACGDWNELVSQQITYDRIDTPQAKAEREEFRAKSPLGDVQGPALTMTETSEVSNAASPYAGKIFVLVDRASGSSGESAPDMLRVALGAKIVGERTAGDAEYGDVRPYVMPRTGVVWQMGTKRNFYAAPRDGVGLAVDAYLSDDLLEAPVEELLPLLEKFISK